MSSNQHIQLLAFSTCTAKGMNTCAKRTSEKRHLHDVNDKVS